MMYTRRDIEDDAFWNSLSEEHLECFRRLHRRIMDAHRENVLYNAMANSAESQEAEHEASGD